jgi:hypothetical protein
MIKGLEIQDRDGKLHIMQLKAIISQTLKETDFRIFTSGP